MGVELDFPKTNTLGGSHKCIRRRHLGALARLAPQTHARTSGDVERTTRLTRKLLRLLDDVEQIAAHWNWLAVRLGTEVIELAGRAIVREDHVELLHSGVGQAGNALSSSLVGSEKLEVKFHPHLGIYIFKPLPRGIVRHSLTAGQCPESHQAKKEYPHARRVRMPNGLSNPLNELLIPQKKQ